MIRRKEGGGVTDKRSDANWSDKQHIKEYIYANMKVNIESIQQVHNITWSNCVRKQSVDQYNMMHAIFHILTKHNEEGCTHECQTITIFFMQIKNISHVRNESNFIFFFGGIFLCQLSNSNEMSIFGTRNIECYELLLDVVLYGNAERNND